MLDTMNKIVLERTYSKITLINNDIIIITRDRI